MNTRGDAARPEDKRRLLVIDDEMANLFMFKRVLRKGYEITLVSGAQEALLRLGGAGEPPAFDVVLVDYAMPDMNGATFLEKLRATHPHLPCLLITAYAHVEEVKATARKYGVAAVIPKPWRREDVEQSIEQSIAAARLKGVTTAPRR